MLDLAVLVPVRNAAPHLPACITSILAENPRELWLWDDASDDNSAEIIRRFADRYPLRIRATYSRHHRGVCESRNLLTRAWAMRPSAQIPQWLSYTDADDARERGGWPQQIAADEPWVWSNHIALDYSRDRLNPTERWITRAARSCAHPEIFTPPPGTWLLHKEIILAQMHGVAWDPSYENGLNDSKFLLDLRTALGYGPTHIEAWVLRRRWRWSEAQITARRLHRDDNRLRLMAAYPNVFEGVDPALWWNRYSPEYWRAVTLFPRWRSPFSCEVDASRPETLRTIRPRNPEDLLPMAATAIAQANAAHQPNVHLLVEQWLWGETPDRATLTAAAWKTTFTTRLINDLPTDTPGPTGRPNNPAQGLQP